MPADGAEKVAMRSDTAGYQWDLLRYCAEGKGERFVLKGMESDQAALPFPVIDYQDQDHPRRFKLFGVVTNLDLATGSSTCPAAWSNMPGS